MIILKIILILILCCGLSCSLSFLVFMLLHTCELLPGRIMLWCCKHLDWHKRDDGCSFTSRCKYCKKEILQDLQGNWYSTGKNE